MQGNIDMEVRRGGSEGLGEEGIGQFSASAQVEEYLGLRCKNATSGGWSLQKEPQSRLRFVSVNKSHRDVMKESLTSYCVNS